MNSVQRAHIDINTLLPSSDSRYFSPEEVDAAINFAVLNLFNQQYKIFGESMRISDELARFKTTAPIPLSVGVGAIPPNHLYTLSLYVTKIGTESIIKRVHIVEEQFIPQYIDSEAFAPDADHVIARFVGSNVEFYPSIVTEAGMTYLRKPVDCKYAYTLTGVLQNIPAFDPVNSVPIDYSDAAYNQILEKALAYLGYAQKDNMLIQMEAIDRKNSQPEAR